jgi:hypothetical protein
MRKTTFFGLPCHRQPGSSRPWMSLSDLASALGRSKEVLIKRAAAHPLAPFRTVLTGSLVKYNRTLAVDIEFYLAMIFSDVGMDARSHREAVIRVLSNLAVDGFVATHNYHLPVHYRRAIAARICGVPHYLDIVTQRWDPQSDSYGSNLAPHECDASSLTNPDHFIRREEITQIKALDLAAYLLVSTCGTSDLTHDTSVSMLDKLFGIMGCDLDAGQLTEQRTQDLGNFVHLKLGDSHE